MRLLKDNFLLFELIPLEETYQELGDVEILENLKVLDTRNVPSSNNYFMTKPQGIIIQDSYNNFAFPIRPEPRVDSNKFDMKVLSLKFRELYLSFKSDSLPWHYVIEMVGNKYYMFNTRPITMRYPVKHDELISRESQLPFNVKWNFETKDFMNKRKFLINEAIHVCVLGDSTIDVYSKNFYRVLGSFGVRPFIHYFKLPQSSKTRTYSLNMGSKFNFEYLFKFLYK